MKIVIVGAGATGGCIGGYLARMGRDVTFIARGENLRVLRERGLTIRRSQDEDIQVAPVKACTMDEYQKTPDVIFICVKYYSLDAAIAFVRRVASPSTLIIPVLDAFGVGEVMQAQLPDLTCLDGCIYVWAKREAPGIVVQPERTLRIVFGFRPGQDRRLYTKAQVAEQGLCGANIQARLSTDIRRDALEKFAFVSPLEVTGLYLDAVCGDMQAGGRAHDLFLALVQEIQALGQGMGIQFSHDIVAAADELLAQVAPKLTTSLQRDVAAGNRSEFSGLVDRVVELGSKYQVPVPWYEKISRWGHAKHIR